jgi:hypothetical protein
MTMAFTYKGMNPAVAAATAAGDGVYKITPNNVRPLLVLWLFVVTNGTFFDASLDPTRPPLDATTKLDIANRLGLTPETVDFVMSGVLNPAVLPAFQQVASVFRTIGQSGDYSDIFCVSDYTQILALAPSAQVADPSK